MLRIILSPRLTPEHRSAILKYITRQGELTGSEAAIALEAFNLLAESQVACHEETRTFAAVYERLIDRTYADDFIERLLSLPEPEQMEANALKATIARQIMPRLRAEGLYDPKVPESAYLLAYAYWWWDAFAKGYIFEAQVFDDLARSGIEFVAHDIRRRAERLSPADLIVLGHPGDIKHSTYFLLPLRVSGLKHDFYIVRLYHPAWRRIVWAVILREAMWQEINGEPVHGELKQATELFPAAVRIEFPDGALIVVEYEQWKAKVKAHQEKEQTDD
jgi:hypothetical protein